MFPSIAVKRLPDYCSVNYLCDHFDFEERIILMLICLIGTEAGRQMLNANRQFCSPISPDLMSVSEIDKQFSQCIECWEL